MIETLPSSPDVIAIRIRERLVLAELEPILERMEASLRANEKTHVYVEVEQLRSVEASGIGGYVGRAVALLGKLGRFGRVAAVADQSWIRWAARIESALLPGIRYETFTSAERERALAWVEGKAKLAHGSSLKLIETDRPGTLGFEVDGRISEPETERLAARMDELARGEDRLRLLVRVRNIGGAELGAILGSDYLRMKWNLLDRVERYAMVGGPSWLKASTNTLDRMFKGELRHFRADEEAAAWAWLEARPLRESVLVSDPLGPEAETA
jgi:hypothetical protein